MRSPRETPLRQTQTSSCCAWDPNRNSASGGRLHIPNRHAKRLTMPPSGRRRMRGERLFLEPVSRKAMPVQFCCCGLVETACRSHAHHPEASADRAVGSAHYPVALMAVTLVVARARVAVHQPTVMPADCLLAVRRSTGFRTSRQRHTGRACRRTDPPPGGTPVHPLPPHADGEHRHMPSSVNAEIEPDAGSSHVTEIACPRCILLCRASAGNPGVLSHAPPEGPVLWAGASPRSGGHTWCTHRPPARSRAS